MATDKTPAELQAEIEALQAQLAARPTWPEFVKSTLAPVGKLASAIYENKTALAAVIALALSLYHQCFPRAPDIDQAAVQQVVDDAVKAAPVVVKVEQQPVDHGKIVADVLNATRAPVSIKGGEKPPENKGN
jgi:hypothetical protein